MILFRYFLLRFLSMFLRVFMIFFGILLMIGTVDQLSSLKQNQGVGHAAYLSLLSQSRTMLTILPLLTAITAVSVFVGLSRSSELVVVRAAGRSGLRFLLAPLTGAILVGLIGVSVFDPLVAATSKLYRLETRDKGASAVLTVQGGGIWMRQGDAQSQSVIQAQQVSSDGKTFFNISVYSFDSQGTPITVIEADEARLIPNAWQVFGAMKWNLQDENPQATAEPLPEGALIATDISVEKLSRGFSAPSDIAFWALPNYIADLEKSGFSARAHRVWLQMEMALPLTLAVMVLIAAGFTMRHARAGKTGQMVLYALLAAFAIFFLRNFAQVLGQNGQIPIFLAAWGAPFAALLLAISLLLHLEDG